ncbi:glycosyltransferase [Intestinibacter bartlettii]|uniref:glycosyltransferase n=1 Tax=Intestinibacter bartlettii TaxID=261299 RepID=UPI001D1100D7|nr:glycosyltransferase [Intestinibacter bartlettii]MCC2707588.1 glycosyltransferase [Intestinibacter bartlettii]MCC2763038.1 glycosyltransferase [Intestinibacter bartlettii]
MKKILFFIPNLMHGGAEKVLINLVNNLDKSKYDITLQTIFDVGVNKQYLNKDITYKYVFKRLFKGSTTIFKLFSSTFLYKYLIKDEYDIVISYLEGPTARIISGCPYKSKKVNWIHTEIRDEHQLALGFRNSYEAKVDYAKFNKIICVSNTVKQTFSKISGLKETNMDVLYNTNETEQIIDKSKDIVDDVSFDKNTINICSVGKITKVKGYKRLAKIHKKLINEGLKHHIYILGIGECEENIKKYIEENNLQDTYTLLGFRDNPYKYVSKCDLFVCSSYREGFSTAVTESLVVGTPVVSTLCSGAQELLGYNNEYGLVVENSEEGIYEGIKKLLEDRELLAYYKEKAIERGSFFSKEKTVKAVEDMIDSL